MAEVIDCAYHTGIIVQLGGADLQPLGKGGHNGGPDFGGNGLNEQLLLGAHASAKRPRSPERSSAMWKIFELIGRYFMLMGKVFSRPEKAAIYRRRIIYEMESLGIDSIGLTAIISVFIGAVITLQMCINLDSPFIPRSLVGYATRETMILEFSSTVVALILAGKVGSSIASEIGTMRITEQIDALEIMGVNSASYLILPKIVAAVVFFPFLTILSIAIGIIGGWAIAYLTGIMIPADYVDGLLMDFKPYSIVYSLIKTAVFAYIITSISAFYGYYAKGNSLEVGAASTRAVVASSVVIMIFNLILTQVLLI